MWNIHYRHDPTNPGVSRAYNEGCKLARQLGKNWLLLLDQDTAFPDTALDVYCKAKEEHPDAEVFVPVLQGDGMICSPCRYVARTGFPLAHIAPGWHSFKGKAVVNSGMLVSADLFERCGGFDERIRLDFADFAFNKRLRRHIDGFYVLPFQCSHGFSGRERLSCAAALQRFELFCEGARNSIDGYADAVLYRLVMLKRCFRLTVQFRSLAFLSLYRNAFKD
nr:hypothetical protein [Geotalea sp. SG265]